MEKQIIAWFDLIGGLPLHPMIVHLLIVATPLIAVLALFVLPLVDAGTGGNSRLRPSST